MNGKVQNWQIWIADVYFEEDPTQSKRRPALVIPDGNDISVLKITSQDNHNKKRHKLIKWAESGLKCPSFVILDQIIILSQSDMIRQIGVIHPLDKYQVRLMLERLTID